MLKPPSRVSLPPSSVLRSVRLDLREWPLPSTPTTTSWFGAGKGSGLVGCLLPPVVVAL